MPQARQPTIILVEDDPAHATLVRRTLQRGGFDNEVVTLDDGQKAVDYLIDQRAEDPENDALCVLLDLNLPRLSGFQVLERLKAETRTRRIPIVVLTTTDNPVEVERCYTLGCNAYVTKPVDFARFKDTIQAIGSFLSVITLPNPALS